ncbi:MAG: cell division protein FtsZ [Bacteroidetes bacterium]|nr:cell division protein FtsZ [Bacteroidota bacterium]
MQFNLPKEQSSIIKVIGVGGGGSNAVNHMYRQGITGVDFLICNTDQQALDISPVPNKIQLGTSLTDGRGAGSLPNVGQHAAMENIEEIRALLSKNTRMVFITAGMGGGTGTGAAPVIAQVAKEMGILTVGIVTYPFLFEGRKRAKQAEEGIAELRRNVDTLLVVCNDKLREIYGNLSLSEAFGKADDILTTAAKGIAEIITVTGYINVDFEDVRTVMRDSGAAIMGSAKASGENRAMIAVQNALASPLLNDNNIKGANYILLNITSGSKDVTMDEIAEITDYIQDEAGSTAEIIWGTGIDETLGDNVSVTLIATGFKTTTALGADLESKPSKVVHKLELEKPAVKQPQHIAAIQQPVAEAPVFKEVVPVLKTEAPVVFVAPEPEKIVLPEPVVFTAPLIFDEVVEQEVPSVNEVEEVVAKAPEVEQVTLSFEPELSEIEEEEPIMEEGIFSFKEDELPAGWEVKSVGTVEEELPVVPVGVKKLYEESVEEMPKALNTPKVNPVVSEPVQTPRQTPTPDFVPALNVKQEEEPVAASTTSFSKELDAEDQMRQSQERIMKLKALSHRMKSPTDIVDLENEPAYKRKNINLDKIPHSSESTISRYTLSQDETEGPEIRPNNSFLHDNVD